MGASIDILASDGVLLSTLASKKFLITGGEGMLGRAFASQVRRYLPDAEVRVLGRAELDVRRIEQFSPWLDFKPDYVIHCAAVVDADLCEENPHIGRESIVGGTLNVLNFAKQCGAKVFYPQSFLIFDDVGAVIDESTQPRPLCDYGRMKYEAEKAVLSASSEHTVVRMAGFFGGYERDTNFVGRIVPHLAKLIKEDAGQIAIGNRVWQPTYTEDLAANSLLLLAAGATGVYCMSSHGAASFYELAKEIVRILGVSRRLKIAETDARVMAGREKARRPLSAIMENRRMKVEGLDRQRNWAISLADYLESNYFKEMFR